MKKYSTYFGFLGFLGFGGFGYFANHDVGNLFMFSFFAAFGYFFVGKLAKEMPDERFIENSVKARSKILPIPLLLLFIVGFSAFFPFGTIPFVVLVSAIGWAATILAYAFLFYHYEKH